MSREARDELILRHLDGETTLEERAQVTRLLTEDLAFRARFFAFVGQTARLREMLGTAPAAEVSPNPAAAAPSEEKRMNIDYRQIYFNAALGGIGGLLAWPLIYILEAILAGANVWLLDAVKGPLIGICIGAAIGCTEGIVASRSLRRMLHGANYGAALGAVGGLIGIMLGEGIFLLFGGGVWARAVGWAIFGMLVGTSDGFAQRLPSKIRYGLVGGLLGGLIGGSSYEVLGQFFEGDLGNAFGSAVGLIILGACIGALIGLVESLLRKAWLFFVTGRLEGQTRSLDSSRPYSLGSADSCTIVLPGDPTVLPVHAEIVWEAGDFVIRPRDGKVVWKRDGLDEPVKSHVLQPGDRVQLGETRWVFRNEEGKSRVPVKKRPLQEVKS